MITPFTSCVILFIDCSGHGQREGLRCVCDEGWVGQICESMLKLICLIIVLNIML